MGADLQEAKRVCKEDGKLFEDWCGSEECPVGRMTAFKLMAVHSELGGKSTPSVLFEHGFNVLAAVTQTRDEDQSGTELFSHWLITQSALISATRVHKAESDIPAPGWAFIAAATALPNGDIGSRVERSCRWISSRIARTILAVDTPGVPASRTASPMCLRHLCSRTARRSPLCAKPLNATFIDKRSSVR